MPQYLFMDLWVAHLIWPLFHSISLWTSGWHTWFGLFDSISLWISGWHTWFGLFSTVSLYGSLGGTPNLTSFPQCLSMDLWMAHLIWSHCHSSSADLWVIYSIWPLFRGTSLWISRLSLYVVVSLCGPLDGIPDLVSLPQYLSMDLWMAYLIWPLYHSTSLWTTDLYATVPLYGSLGGTPDLASFPQYLSMDLWVAYLIWPLFHSISLWISGWHTWFGLFSTVSLYGSLGGTPNLTSFPQCLSMDLWMACLIWSHCHSSSADLWVIYSIWPLFRGTSLWISRPSLYVVVSLCGPLDGIPDLVSLPQYLCGPLSHILDLVSISWKLFMDLLAFPLCRGTSLWTSGWHTWFGLIATVPLWTSESYTRFGLYFVEALYGSPGFPSMSLYLSVDLWVAYLIWSLCRGTSLWTSWLTYLIWSLCRGTSLWTSWLTYLIWPLCRGTSLWTSGWHTWFGLYATVPPYRPLGGIPDLASMSWYLSMDLRARVPHVGSGSRTRVIRPSS